MTRIPTTNLATIRNAKRKADSQRFMYLAALSDGDVTVSDIIEAACSDGGEYLLKIKLRALLENQPGWGAARARTALENFLAAVPGGSKPHKPHIGWLVDPRASGRRILVWANTMQATRQPPWSGFPYSPQPDGELAR